MTTPLKEREQGVSKKGLDFLTLKSVAENLCQRSKLKHSQLSIALFPHLAHQHRTELKCEDAATARNERPSQSTQMTKGKSLRSQN